MRIVRANKFSDNELIVYYHARNGKYYSFPLGKLYMNAEWDNWYEDSYINCYVRTISRIWFWDGYVWMLQHYLKEYLNLGTEGHGFPISNALLYVEPYRVADRYVWTKNGWKEDTFQQSW